MSIFDRLDRLASRAVDSVNSSTVILTPMTSTPNGRPFRDTARQVVTVRGVFDYIAVDYGLQLGVRKSYREGNDLRSIQSGRDPQLSIDRRYFPTEADEPRQGDLLQLPGKPELPKFQVAKAQRDGLSRMVLDLVAIGGQA